jgi:predicted metal-dependent hydrolase
VRAPFGKDKLEIQGLVLGKASWILKKQKEYKEKIPEVAMPSFKENTALPYLGANYPLKINKEQINVSINLVDGKFLVYAKSPMITFYHIKKLYENWLIEKAQSLFEDKVEKYSKKLGVRVKRIAIKNLRNRWEVLLKVVSLILI